MLFWHFFWVGEFFDDEKKRFDLTSIHCDLVFSFGTGIYQGYVKSKQTTTNEFLVASGQMKVLLPNDSIDQLDYFSFYVDSTDGNESLCYSDVSSIFTWNACRSLLLRNDVHLLWYVDDF